MKGWTFDQLWALSTQERRWYIRRLNMQFEKEKQEYNKATKR